MKTSLQVPFSSYKIRKLGINEKVKSFDCGDADLNDFILNASTLYREALLAVTYYLKQKFVPLTVEDEGADTRLLYFDLNDIAD